MAVCFYLYHDPIVSAVCVQRAVSTNCLGREGDTVVPVRRRKALPAAYCVTYPCRARLSYLVVVAFHARHGIVVPL